jgi:hypothetical protein
MGSTRKGRTVTLTWTGVITSGSTDQAPDTDSIIYMDGAEYFTVTFDTTPATTGTPNFDLHSIGTNTDTFPSSHFQDGIVSAQAINVVSTTAMNRGPKYMKLRLDVNAANLAASEYVVATVWIDAWRTGRQTPMQ